MAKSDQLTFGAKLTTKKAPKPAAPKKAKKPAAPKKAATETASPPADEATKTRAAAIKTLTAIEMARRKLPAVCPVCGAPSSEHDYSPSKKGWVSFKTSLVCEGLNATE